MDLKPACEQVIAELQAVDPDAHLSIEMKGDLTGEWDGDRLTQAFSNLVANALQYGCEEGPVTVVVQAHGDEVVLRVHNEGHAISEEAQRTLFEPMVRQQSTSGDRNPTGMGLGLYIAREVALAHGGTLEATSTEEAGTTFTLKVPRSASSHGAKGTR